MNALLDLLGLSDEEKSVRGLLDTPREIAQQPSTWAATFACFQKHGAEIRNFLQSAGIGGGSNHKPTVFLLGAGTSDYIGQSLVHLLQRRWQCQVIAIPSTSLVTHFEESLVPGQKYLWMSFSRSGDSPESVAVLERALRARPDIHHLIVSCNAKGRMIRLAAEAEQALGICLGESVNDRGLAMTSSYSNMVVFGQCLAHVDAPVEYEEVLGQMIESGKTFLGAAAECAAELAKGPYTRACFVGSGPLRAVASESALKLLELTAGKTQTLSESTLGLRHGPMATLNEETLFVCFLSGDERIRKYETDLLEEIGRKRLIRTRVVVSRESAERFNGLAERLLAPGSNFSVADEYRPPVDVIFGQLLGLFFSIRWGLTPDSPSSNGAISRVVQNVNI